MIGERALGSARSGRGRGAGSQSDIAAVSECGREGGRWRSRYGQRALGTIRPLVVAPLAGLTQGRDESEGAGMAVYLAFTISSVKATQVPHQS